MELETTDFLYGILCGDEAGECTYPSPVTLDTNYSPPMSSSVLFSLDSIRVVKMNNVFYEYVSIPCVDLPFYNGGKTIKWSPDGLYSMCAPAYSLQGSSCCSFGEFDTRSLPNQCQYPGERVKYETHDDRCFQEAKPICKDITRISPTQCGSNDCCSVHLWVSVIGKPVI